MTPMTFFERFYSRSSQETIHIGGRLAQMLLSRSSLICLCGELGTGKTTLIKGMIATLTGTDPHEVVSPTFTYLQTYSGQHVVHHFDLYRLKDKRAFVHKGFLDYLHSNCPVLIEWPEKIFSLLDSSPVTINLLYQPEESHRTIVVKQ